MKTFGSSVVVAELSGSPERAANEPTGRKSSDRDAVAPQTGLPRPWSFSQTLKEPATEELINRYWHRPLAFQLIRPMARFSATITPNHLTSASGFTGVAAGAIAYLAATHGQHLLLVAGLLLFVSVLFDCSDGMWARLTGQSSRLGMLLDGFVDLLVGLSTWFGLTTALVALIQPPWAWPWAVFVLLNCLVHCGLYDQYKNTFARHVAPDSQTPELGGGLDRPDHPVAWFFDAVYRHAYGSIAMFFGRPTRQPSTPMSPERFRAQFTRPMQLFGFLGLGTHMFIIYSSALVGAVAPSIGWYAILLLITGALNVIMVWALLSWRTAVRKARGPRPEA